MLVHGRGARREETIRAMPPLLAQGWTCLAPSYRNDEGVPAGPDGRYALGLSEWRDVEAAIRVRRRPRVPARCCSWGGRWAARSCCSCSTARRCRRWCRGWCSTPRSSTGATCWPTTRASHRVPPHVGSLARAMMRQRWGHRLVGVHEGVDLAKTDWVRRGDELHHRVLLIHSADDEFVPCGPSRELARARPDLVTLRGVARRPALQGVEHRARALGAPRRRLRGRLTTQNFGGHAAIGACPRSPA